MLDTSQFRWLDEQLKVLLNQNHPTWSPRQPEMSWKIHLSQHSVWKSPKKSKNCNILEWDIFLTSFKHSKMSFDFVYFAFVFVAQFSFVYTSVFLFPLIFWQVQYFGIWDESCIKKSGKGCFQSNSARKTSLLERKAKNRITSGAKSSIWSFSRSKAACETKMGK